MIAFKNKRPLLQTGHCVISDYDREWLESVLQQAADAAGVRLPFREEIARAILLYLEEKCPLHAVPLEYLFQRIRNMLCQAGLPRIAEHLRLQTPPVVVDPKDIIIATLPHLINRISNLIILLATFRIPI